jgi:hypothetical protein
MPMYAPTNPTNGNQAATPGVAGNRLAYHAGDGGNYRQDN